MNRLLSALTALLDHPRALPVLVVGGLALRLAVFAILPPQHFPDAHGYMVAGHQLMTTGMMTGNHIMPLYPLLVGLAGGGYAIKWVDVAVSTLLIYLLYHLALALFANRRVAVLAALAAAIYPFFLFYAISGLTETTYLAILVGAYLCLYRDRPWLGSLLLVLSILERPTLDLLAPVLVVLFARIVHRHSWRRTGADLTKYALIYLVLMTPWWLYNEARYGQFVPLDLGAGQVLYAGNNPMNKSGGGVVLPGNKGDVSYAQFNHIADPVARNRAMERAALAYIRSHPRHFIAMSWVKFIRFWRLWPYAPHYSGVKYILASLLSFGMVLLLSLVYLAWMGRRDWRRVLPILALAAYLTLVSMVIIGSIRYRLPVEPFMIVLAAAAAIGLLERRRPEPQVLD